MATIQLREQETRPDGSLVVRVVYPDSSEFEVAVADPASEADEELLAWYFERHLRFPFLDWDKRAAAVKLLDRYGRELFAQVFAGEPGEGYRSFRKVGFDGCRIEVTGGTGMHRLHWEALADPALDSPVALRVPITRRVDRNPPRFDLPGPRPTLNILVVTARPDGAGDVGYRTVSRPLVTAMHQSPLRVTIDLVRPGTWRALREHLAATRDRHGTGWYQLIHFDLHGAFADHAAIAAGHANGRFLFAGREAFEGRRGFLFFETAATGTADPRSAEEIAGLLAEHRVPMAVLNACQSAMATATEAALAQQLVQAGVPVVVGMAYSVTVTAAELSMPQLYRRLVEHENPDVALQAMRRALRDSPDRCGYFDQTLPLQDWVLPVVFQQQPVRLALREMTDPETEVFYARQDRVDREPEPEYGFLGRDLDIQAIEHALLVDDARNHLLVRGMAGAGKSTLLRHVGWWWQRTGLVDQVFAFSFEDRAWTANQMVRTIAQQLWGPVEFARWDQLSETAGRARVAQALRASRHLLVIDNAESITAGPAAIPHALNQDERDQLRGWIRQLRGGRTLVVWGSREAETWVAADSFAGNVHQLGGLDPQAASALTDRILTRFGVTHYRDDAGHRDALNQIIKLLEGYPLPLEVVLPALATTPPATVLEELTAGGHTADPAGLIQAAIEYSHGKLDPALQHSLLLLAPFTATIPAGDVLAGYQELLAGLEPDDDPWGPLDLPAALDAATGLGLAIPHPELEPLSQVVPVLPYFLRQRLREHPRWKDATEFAHGHFYAQLGLNFHGLLTGTDPQQRRVGQAVTAASYANLSAASSYAAHHGLPVLPALCAVEELLDQLQQHEARLQWLSDIIATITEATPDSVELPEFLHLAGMAAQELRRFGEAERHYGRALSLKLESGNRHSAATTYGQLGRVAQDQRRFGEAERHYQQALDLFLEFDDRYGAARTYHNFGTAAQELRRFDEAEHRYRRALDLKLESNDRDSAATTYHQLGMVAQDQRRFDEAQRHLQQALDLKLEFNNRYGAASSHHELGVVAHELQRLGEAERHYQQALDLFLEFDDRHGAASSYHQLGMVAHELRRLDEAERHLQRAVDLKLEFDDRHGAASSYHQLGVVAQARQRFDEAERHYEHAIDLKLEFDDRHDAASSYHQLGVVAQARQRFEEAERHYRQALEAFREAGDDRSASAVTTSLSRLLAETGRHDEAFAMAVDAAVSWQRLTGQFDPDDLALVAAERRHVGDDLVRQILDDLGEPVPDELTEAISPE
ncbi:tetratricopeptide repeat protein [Amycolatopsis vancoresmycina]|uniref:tetratricopeptide repeat protein n=1 Tax=Amycolatopsis vancoresmycina TaxID=208444 RepID=UPI000692048F|nr:tetratricopeptide repeat protein [Amycolatopsis vancoresmycina]